MLKKIAFILGFPVLVFFAQNGIIMLSNTYPLMVAPALVLMYPLISFLYGYFSYTLIKYLSILISAVSFMAFCFMSVNPGSVIYSAYYALLCLAGIWLKKRTTKK